MINVLIDLLLLILGIYRLILPVGNAFGGPEYIERVKNIRTNVGTKRVARKQAKFSFMWQGAFDVLIIGIGISDGDLLCLFAGIVLLFSDLWRARLWFYNNKLKVADSAQQAPPSQLTPPAI